MLKFNVFIIVLYFCSTISFSAFSQIKIPAVYSNIYADSSGSLYFKQGDFIASTINNSSKYSVDQLMGNPQGTGHGILFDFQDTTFNGTLIYGFIPYDDGLYPQPVFFKRTFPILSGRTMLNIKRNLDGVYDMINWGETGQGTLGYRIIRHNGDMLYDGRVGFEFKNDTFAIDTIVVEGPFVNCVGDDSIIVSLKTNKKCISKVLIDSIYYSTETKTRHHEIRIKNLRADTEYHYTVLIGNHKQSYTFRTAPKPGTRKPFSFAYVSDSRAGQGGGERNLYGANFYMMKKIMAVALDNNCRFVQFTGDLINGYANKTDDIKLQYANWKRAIEPFAHYIPVYSTIGNHEALIYTFLDSVGKMISIDKFPFKTESAEAVFAGEFVNPVNGPESEDNSRYDPDTVAVNFPSYKENVFYYIYDNVAVIVLNSNYWYAPSLAGDTTTSGNLHAYIMDNQLLWLKKTVNQFENNQDIDHIFVTQHTPTFPNGGHVRDDMWYNGNNSKRPYINGKPVEKGIIERRDEYLEILVNQSKKTVAILTGDEHNYNRLLVSDTTSIYPENYTAEKIQITRPVYQINNGAAGAPYYAQEQAPWSPCVEHFTTQNAVVLIHVDGKKINVVVKNPDTLETVDEFILKP